MRGNVGMTTSGHPVDSRTANGRHYKILSSTNRSTKRKKLIFVAAIFFMLILPMLPTVIIYNHTFGRRAESPVYRAFLTYRDVAGFDRRVVVFPSGDNFLMGYIFGEDNYKGLVVVSHSFGDGAEGYFNVIKYFVEHGWRVFAYDKTGSHNSSGNSTRGLAQSALDLDAALHFIAAQEWELPIMLFGHSWGGFAATAVLNFDHEINAVVSLAGYNRPVQILRDTSQRVIGRAGILAHPYLWAYQRYLFGRNAGLTAVGGINSVDIPVKIIHGTADWLIRYDSAGIINYRRDITNPNVVFVTHYLPHHNNHMNLLMTEDAFAYATELNARFAELFYRYAHEENGDACIFMSVYFHHVHMLANRNLARCFCSQIYTGYIPTEALSDFYATIDRHRLSALNIPLMDEINAFFLQTLNDTYEQHRMAAPIQDYVNAYAKYPSNAESDYPQYNGYAYTYAEYSPFEIIFTAEPLPYHIIRQISGSSFHENPHFEYCHLSYLTITHVDFYGKSRHGNIIVAAYIAEEVLDIFREIYEGSFPLAGMRLIDYYYAYDYYSMAANNSVGFNFRYIAGTQTLSRHAWGMAIDINPIQNPFIRGDVVLPAAGRAYLDRTYVRPGMVVPGDVVYNAFTSRGWVWGGHWSVPIDLHHFERRLP